MVAVQDELRVKEQEAVEPEEGAIIAISLWTRVYLAGISAPTLYNNFVYEYAQTKLGITPHQLWLETCIDGQWRDLWLTIPKRERNILAIGWMLGWEEIISYKTPIALA